MKSCLGCCDSFCVLITVFQGTRHSPLGQLLLKQLDLLGLLHDLLAILGDMTIDRDDIANGLRLDFFRTIRVLKRIVRLIVVRARRAHAYDHDCLAIATKRLLEQSSELGVAVWDVAAFAWIAQRIDAVAKGKKRSIDVGAFNQSVTFVLGHTGPLRPGQINDR